MIVKSTVSAQLLCFSLLPNIATAVGPGTPISTLTIGTDLSSADIWCDRTWSGFSFISAEGYSTHSSKGGYSNYHRIGYDDGVDVPNERVCALIGQAVFDAQGAEYARSSVYFSGQTRCDVNTDQNKRPNNVIVDGVMWAFSSHSESDAREEGPVWAAKSLGGHPGWWTFIPNSQLSSPSPTCPDTRDSDLAMEPPSRLLSSPTTPLSNITHVVYKKIPQQFQNDGTINVKAGQKYNVSFEILRNDLGSPSEYVQDVVIDGIHLGGCNPTGGDYDCTFHNCEYASPTTIVATSDTITASIFLVGHSHDCDCDMTTWECSMENTVAGRTPMTAVGRFTLIGESSIQSTEAPSLSPSSLTSSPTTPQTLRPSSNPSYGPTSTSSSPPSSLPSTSPTSTSSSPPSMLIDTIKKYNIILEKSSFDSTQFLLTTEYITSDLSTESQIEMSIMTFDCNATYGGKGLGKNVTDAEPAVSIKTTSLVGPLLLNTFQVEKFALKNSALTSTGNKSDKSIAGELKFCVKAEIIIGAKSVNFRESNIVLDYDLSSNSFSITENDIKKEDIISSEESASNIYSIEACRCNKSSRECFSQIESRQTLNQDSLVNICLHPNSTDVKISELNMKFFHHELSEVFFETVTNSTGIPGQSIISGSGSVSDPFQVTSRLISGLFDNGARTFDIKGTAYLQFHSSTRNLNLRSGDRVLQQEEADGESASYQMSVDIKRREMFESEYDLASFSTPVVAGFLVLVFSIAVIIYKKVS